MADYQQKAESIYQVTRDKPETLDEMIGDYCRYKKVVAEYVRAVTVHVDDMTAEFQKAQSVDRESRGRIAFSRVNMLESDVAQLKMRKMKGKKS